MQNTTPFALAFLILSSIASQAAAQGMPDHVRVALGKIVGEWRMESEEGGKKVISEVDTKWANNESVIVFTWKGTDAVSGRQTSSTGIMGWDAAQQIVVEHEIGADGSTFHGTHHISKDGSWISPYKGSTVVDGKSVFFEAHRKIEFVSKDKWTVTGTHWTLSEEPQKDRKATFKRK